MSNLEKINTIPFLDIFSKLGINTVKDNLTNEYRIQVPGETRISNGSYKLNIGKNVVYANGIDRPQGCVYSFIQKYLSFDKDRDVYKWFEENFNIKEDESKKVAVANIPKQTMLKDLKKYLIGNNPDKEQLNAIKTWLLNRGFESSFLDSEEGESRIRLVFSTIGYCKNPATRKDKNKKWVKSKPVLIFPALNMSGVVGAKLRKINNKPEDEEKYNEEKKDKLKTDSKSINIKGSNSGIIYHSLSHIKSCSELIIVEGEPDYIVLRMLGYDNVIGNLGGVKFGKEIIRDIIKSADIVYIAYDNDIAGREGARILSDFCKRQMFYIKYIDRKNVHGDNYNDINEFFEGGFNKDDFDNMFKNSTKISVKDDGRGEYNNETSKVLLTMSNKNPFIFLRKRYEFYDIYENQMVRSNDVARWTSMKASEIQEALDTGIIKKYYDTCYRKGGKKDHYNILDEKVILQPSEKPEIHEDIKFLIENLCGGNKKNIDWLHKAILYKYININDVLIPAVLLKGVGGTGKGTFIKLLTQIFSKENVMNSLGTQSLISDFCPYIGNKIIVEINELGGGNHRDAKRITEKIKSMVFEPNIMINPKGVQSRNVRNIAWFILASNDPKPMRLDSGASGNRRFTILNSTRVINSDEGTKINDTIDNIDNIRNYLAWLFKTFPDVANYNNIPALENDEKKRLTEQSEEVVESFLSRFENLHPDINKFSVKERNYFLWEYRQDIGEDDCDFDKIYSATKFNNTLPHHVVSTKTSIRGKSVQGYEINKRVNPKLRGYFETDQYNLKIP